MIEDERQLDAILESPDKSLLVEDDRGFSMEKKTFRENVKGAVEDTLRARLQGAKDLNAEIIQITYDFLFWWSFPNTFSGQRKNNPRL